MPQDANTTAALLSTLFPFILLIVVFYFMIIRPQRKREKQTKEMLASLKVGDNITTIGGICGKIVRIRDDILTIEVGTDKVKLVIERWAVRSVDQPISAD
ncbi:MAG: preprotein translocase subunit YajC [Clostridiales bacterium]|jgi:preprotein translocase subunit YajC|nr:preprotein translocase subunit YajC [Clostridiales bacterium]